jgi:hypothetical protein
MRKGVRPWKSWHSVEDSQEFSVRNLNLEILFEVSLIKTRFTDKEFKQMYLFSD